MKTFPWQTTPAADVMKHWPEMPEIDEEAQERELQKLWRESLGVGVQSTPKEDAK